MNFDPAEERPIRLQDVPKITWLPGRRSGSRLNVSTVFRWCQIGCRGQRLEAIRIGGALCTSEAALKRFFARLTDPTKPGSMTPAQRSKQNAKDEAELVKAGF